MDTPRSMIEIQHLVKHFGEGGERVVALNDVNLTVCEGEIFGIIGLSGAGKSTLVRCINRLEEADAGNILVDGVDISTLSAEKLNFARRNMGMIFQQFNLLSQSTVLENVCFPMKLAGWSRAQRKKRAAELLDLVGLGDRVNAYPAELSGGMQQRVAIARALALSPKILLCDEATSALDPATTHSILELITKINRELGVTVVIITHQMEVIEQVCSQVAILDKSRIVECGSVEEIFRRPKSAIARQLILRREGEPEKESFHAGGHCVRLVFDGKNAFEPIVADMVLSAHAAVNILYADMHTIDGATYGQMLVQLPEDAAASERLMAYLRGKDIHFEEVEAYAG